MLLPVIEDSVFLSSEHLTCDMIHCAWGSGGVMWPPYFVQACGNRRSGNRCKRESCISHQEPPVFHLPSGSWKVNSPVCQPGEISDLPSPPQYKWSPGSVHQWFPGGAGGKEPACQCRRQKRSGFHPWVGKIPWRRKWPPTPVFLPGESHGQRGLAGYSLWHHKESNMTKHMSTSVH